MADTAGGPPTTPPEIGKGTLARRNVATAALHQAVSLAVSLIRIPLLLHVLGPAGFGLWSAIIAAAGLSAITDFGLQHAVLQRVAQLRGEGRAGEIRFVVATAFWLSVFAFAVVSAVTVVWLAVSPPFQGQAVKAGVQPSEVRMLVLVTFLASFAAQPAKLLQTAQQGFERIYWLNVCSIASSVVQLVGLWLLTSVSRSLLVLGVWAIAWDLLASIAIAIVLGRRYSEYLSVYWRDVRRHTVVPLARQATAFFFTTVAHSLRWSVDSIVILSVLGPTSVTRYQPTARLFLTGLAVVPLVFGSLWPSFTESAARSDLEWVGRVFRVASLCVMGFGVVLAVTMTSFGKDFVLRWVGEPAFSGYSVLLMLNVWFLLMIWAQISSQVVISLGGAASVMKWGLVEGAVNIALSVVLAHHLGLPGVALASLLAIVPFGIVPITWRLRLLGKGRVSLPVPQIARLVGLTVALSVIPGWWGVHRSAALSVPALVLLSALEASIVAAAVWRLVLSPGDRFLVRGQLRAAVRLR